MLWPETVEEFADGAQAIRPNHEQVAGALTLPGHQAGTPKDLQVVGDDLLGHPQLLGDLPNRTGLLANTLQDSAPGAVGQRAQSPVDRCSCVWHVRIQAAICTNVNWWSCGLLRRQNRLRSGT